MWPMIYGHSYFLCELLAKIRKTLTRMYFCEKKKSQLEDPDVVGIVKINCDPRTLPAMSGFRNLKSHHCLSYAQLFLFEFPVKDKEKRTRMTFVIVNIRKLILSFSSHLSFSVMSSNVLVFFGERGE